MSKHPIITGLLSLILAGVIWLPALRFFFTEPPENYTASEGLPLKARQLMQRHLDIWNDPELRRREIEKMRISNAEWDFMARCFFVWSLANIGMRDQTLKDDALHIMDRIIDETMELERQKGMHFFLMSYSRLNSFIVQPERSLFLDGEIALMIALRRLLEEKDEYRPKLQELVNTMVSRMEQSQVLSAESYPNECWLFCNSVALASVKIADALDGSNHDDFFKRWINTAKARLIEPKTGLLNSSYTLHGEKVFDKPEGSSIWMAAHCLALIDREFASDQYERAKLHLANTLAGFGYAYEWPLICEGRSDVDSGPIIPVLNLSAGSTGLAFVGAATFGDGEYLKVLHRSLNLGGFPETRDDRIFYHASNQVGDAVLLYSMVLGPAWERINALDTARKNLKKP